MMSILLFGGSGRLGQEIRAAINVVAPTHAEVDIRDPRAIDQAVERHRPEVIINAAAIVGARQAANEREKTYEVNVSGAANVARAALKRHLRLVFVSTDTVFDGERGMYREEDLPNPINFYSLTKLLGECHAAMVPDALIVRTSFMPKDQFPYPAAFTDQFTSRVTADKLAKELKLAITWGITGVLNIAGERETLFEKARRVAPHVQETTRAQSGLSLPRDLSLDCTRWREIKRARGVAAAAETGDAR